MSGLDSVAVADIDDKNGPEIIFQSSTSGAGLDTVNVLLNNGDGTFAPFERLTARGYVSTGGGEQVIAVGDFDRNDRPDLVTVGRYDKWASVLLNGPADVSCPTFTKPKLKIGRMLAPSGDDTIACTASIPAPADPPDPDLAGLTILLADVTRTVLDVTLPPRCVRQGDEDRLEGRQEAHEVDVVASADRWTVWHREGDNRREERRAHRHRERDGR